MKPGDVVRHAIGHATVLELRGDLALVRFGVRGSQHLGYRAGERAELEVAASDLQPLSPAGAAAHRWLTG